jgi:hypothetical protein
MERNHTTKVYATLHQVMGTLFAPIPRSKPPPPSMTRKPRVGFSPQVEIKQIEARPEAKTLFGSKFKPTPIGSIFGKNPYKTMEPTEPAAEYHTWIQAKFPHPLEPAPYTDEGTKTQYCCRMIHRLQMCLREVDKASVLVPVSKEEAATPLPSGVALTRKMSTLQLKTYLEGLYMPNAPRETHCEI